MRTSALCLLCTLLTGCRPAAAPPVNTAANALMPSRSESLKLHPSHKELTAWIVESQHKRVWGRKRSLQDVERIARDLTPIMEEAARQPSVQDALRLMARDSGITLEQARERWIRLHEADVLLESGGDPELVSVAGATGVAQWMPESAARAGIRLNLAESKRLTAQIDPLKRKVAWLEYLARPDSDPLAPGAPNLSRAEARRRLPPLRAALERLRALRRRVDPRYDPRPSLMAQARYLLNLYPRFPSLDWVFQAYHGGEGGVRRTLRTYLGSDWPGSAESAIRTGPLTFEDLYFGLNPLAKPASFSYVYGRLDDHRYYWWKIRSALEAFALYRRDPAELRRRWLAFLPGRPKEAYWYPNPGKPYRTADDLQSAQGLELIPLTPVPQLNVRPVTIESRPFTLIRPEALGAARLVTTVFRRNGGRSRLTIGDTTLTTGFVSWIQTIAAMERYRRLGGVPPDLTRDASPRSRRLFDAIVATEGRTRQFVPPDPDPRPGGGPPDTFNYHVTGLAFDILRPSEPRERKVLEYALGYLSDRRVLWWRTADTDSTGINRPHYHVVPNPRFRSDLAAVSREH